MFSLTVTSTGRDIKQLEVFFKFLYKLLLVAKWAFQIEEWKQPQAGEQHWHLTKLVPNFSTNVNTTHADKQHNSTQSHIFYPLQRKNNIGDVLKSNRSCAISKSTQSNRFVCVILPEVTKSSTTDCAYNKVQIVAVPK